MKILFASISEFFGILAFLILILICTLESGGHVIGEGVFGIIILDIIEIFLWIVCIFAGIGFLYAFSKDSDAKNIRFWKYVRSTIIIFMAMPIYYVIYSRLLYYLFR